MVMYWQPAFLLLVHFFLAVFASDSDLRIERQTSQNSISTFSDSPLTIRSSTPRLVSFSLKTARFEDLAIWAVLFRVPEFVQQLFEHFVSFEGNLEDESLLWPRLATFAALKRLDLCGEELLDELVTAPLHAMHQEIMSSSESLIDVWDAILMSLPEPVNSLFYFPEPHHHFIKIIHVQEETDVNLLESVADFISRECADFETLPKILTFGFKRPLHVTEDQTSTHVMYLPPVLQVGSKTYERFASISPANSAVGDSPYISLVRSSRSDRWKLFSFTDDEVIDASVSDYDKSSVLVFYRLQTPKFRLIVPERLVDYAMLQKTKLIAQRLPANDPLQKAAIQADCSPILTSLLVGLLGNPHLLQLFSAFENVPKVKALSDFYQKILAGETINLCETELLRQIQNSVPSELSILTTELWVQLCRFIFPVQMIIGTELGRLVDGEFVVDRRIAVNILTMAPNDYFEVGEDCVMLTYEDYQTRIHPIGSVFAMAVNRVPIGDENLDPAIDIRNMDSARAQIFAFVCFDAEQGGYYTFFVHYQPEGDWNWVLYKNNAPITILPQSHDTNRIIRTELSRKSVFIFFRTDLHHEPSSDSEEDTK